ncbi:MAG: hypothetical protein M3T55_14420 [Pseudomonadota bacterium]|nr:hypothetical protein [Pseudomonadota bacterium]
MRELWSARRASRTLALAAPLFVGLAATTAHATVAISNASTKNMSCSGNVCSPTAADAVLNASDLQTMLASANVTVTSGSLARGIVVAAPLTWTSGVTLTLDAWRSLTVKQPVSVTGTGGLTILTNDGGAGGIYSFGSKGHVTFASLSSPLTINNKAYTLVNSLGMLAGDTFNYPVGFYALANSYDASADGTYVSAPITSTFFGIFDGLGNTVSKLSIDDVGPGDHVGLFSELDGTVENLALVDATINADSRSQVGSQVGGFAGHGSGATISHDRISGSITGGGKSSVGGLLGTGSATIAYSSSAASVSAGRGAAGGLVGSDEGSNISQSFASGAVSMRGPGEAGGFIGSAHDGPTHVAESYATGAVSAGVRDSVAGFVADASQGFYVETYAAGSLSGSSVLGGFANNPPPSGPSPFSACYWDTTTSGVNTGTSNGNVAGVTGLTTTQFQSGLPAGFDPTVWAESPDINGGLPYLLANPPQ